MTTITKLGIQGIRSFDHERIEVIAFEKPVTLIVGPNGSGKTTIIECLKMASCGLLPPNARNGHGFIHDPQLAGVAEVKAQIKMLFRTGPTETDKEICAIRSFQLTNRKVAGRIKPQFKALESVLRTLADNGSKSSLGHRCADMDSQVPELMGVSRAIIENVIFCHQEDSSWPHQDAAAVKKRFDDIFGATRYTKALQNIRDLKNEWTKTTRDRRADADLSQAHLDQAAKLSAQKEDRERASEEISAELQGLDTQIASAEEALQNAEMELAQYESSGVRVAELRSLIGRCQREREEVARGMQERGHDIFKESFDELQQHAKHFEERVMSESNQKVQQAKTALAVGDAEYRKRAEEARRLREDMGEAVAAAELLSSRRADLMARLQKAGEPSVAALRSKLDALTSEASRLDREQRQRDAQAEAALAEAEKVFREASLQASRNEARAEDARTVIRRLEEEVKVLARAPPELDALVKKMQSDQAALSADGNEVKLRRLEGQQEEIGRKRHDLQYSVTRKSSEVAQLEAQSDAHVEVDAVRKRLRDAESELGTRLADSRPRLASLLGQMPEAAEAESRVMHELQQGEEALRAQRGACHEVAQRQSGASARRGAAEADLRRLQQEEGRLAAELGVPSAPPLAHGQAPAAGASAAAGDFAARLAAQREQVEACRKDLAMTESAKHMYEKFREKSRAKHACQFCKRSFGRDSEQAAFEEAVEKLIVKIPAYIEQSKRSFQEGREELSRLEGQRPRWERLEQLRQVEMPHRVAAMAKAAEEELAAQVGAEPGERERRRLEDRVRQLHDLRPEAAALGRDVRSIEELRSQVRAKEARLLGANSKVSLQAERDQLRALQEQLNNLGREEDAVRTQRDMLAKQQEQARAQLAEQKGRLQLLQTQVARLGDVSSELSARQNELRECSEQARCAKDAAEASGSRAKTLREERAQLAARFRNQVDARDAEVRALQREVDALSEIERSVEVMRNRVDNADALKARLAAADEAARSAEREVDGLRARLDGEEEKRRKREQVRESLQANLRLKGLEAEAQRHEAEAQGLLQSLGGRDLEALRRAAEASRQRSMELQKQKSFRQGELASTRETAKALELELASPLYAGVEQRHREAIIKHESAAYAAKDLSRYHSALDKALMKFHALKMAEINRTIKETWQRVYRGRDIDYVAIRSDTDETEENGAADPGAGAAGRALKNYNYRVVMVCGGAEMEMRGRCSAGQRVLCCLIIRLALADSFCSNCGVLALDEPTTNLDAANIRGLAEALAGLINARRQHERFQLILITHDDLFVRHLQQLQVCDWYYHIQKDIRGCSKIERRDMRTLNS